MNAEKASFAWAEHRLSLPSGSVTNLDFGQKQGGYCSTCEYTMTGVEVSYRSKKGGIAHEFIDLSYESFAGVLQEIIEAGK